MELVVRSEDYLSYRQDGGVVLFDPRDLRKTFFLIILKASGVLIDITDVHTDRPKIVYDIRTRNQSLVNWRETDKLFYNISTIYQPLEILADEQTDRQTTSLPIPKFNKLQNKMIDI